MDPSWKYGQSDFHLFLASEEAMLQLYAVTSHA